MFCLALSTIVGEYAAKINTTFNSLYLTTKYVSLACNGFLGSNFGKCVNLSMCFSKQLEKIFLLSLEDVIM